MALPCELVEFRPNQWFVVNEDEAMHGPQSGSGVHGPLPSETLARAFVTHELWDHTVEIVTLHDPEAPQTDHSPLDQLLKQAQPVSADTILRLTQLHDEAIHGDRYEHERQSRMAGEVEGTATPSRARRRSP